MFYTTKTQLQFLNCFHVTHCQTLLNHRLITKSKPKGQVTLSGCDNQVMKQNVIFFCLVHHVLLIHFVDSARALWASFCFKMLNFFFLNDHSKTVLLLKIPYWNCQTKHALRQNVLQLFFKLNLHCFLPIMVNDMVHRLSQLVHGGVDEPVERTPLNSPSVSHQTKPCHSLKYFHASHASCFNHIYSLTANIGFWL